MNVNIQTVAGRNLKKSGRPGSNRPPEAWKATALPNELLPLIPLVFLIDNNPIEKIDI